MNTSQIRTHATSRPRPYSFSGNVLGRRWFFSIFPRGALWEEEIDNLPDTVGADKIVPPSQPVVLKFDFEHMYLTGADNRPAHCRIRVYSPVDMVLQGLGQAAGGLISPNSYSSQHPTIILCDPLSAGGITNRAEEIATAIWHQLGRPSQMAWIEHWWKNDTPLSREFVSVQFRVNAHGILVDPQWSQVQRAEVEQVLGSIEEIHRT